VIWHCFSVPFLYFLSLHLLSVEECVSWTWACVAADCVRSYDSNWVDILVGRKLQVRLVRTLEYIHLAIKCWLNLSVIPHVFWLGAARREALGKIMARGHSRVPVYSGGPQNIVGLLLVSCYLSSHAFECNHNHFRWTLQRPNFSTEQIVHPRRWEFISVSNCWVTSKRLWA
jgi:hypothetical protein